MDNLGFDPQKLSDYKRCELQQFCKACGIKANGKTTHLIEALQKFAKAKSDHCIDNEVVIAESIEVKICSSETQGVKQTMMSPSTRRDIFSLKQVLKVDFKEHKPEGKDVTCRIPVANFTDKKVLKATPNKNWAKIHQKSFSRMDSIDDYLNRKKQKVQDSSKGIQSLAQATALKAKEAMELMKKTHNTPKQVQKETVGRRELKSRAPVPGSNRNSALFKSPINNKQEILKPKSAGKSTTNMKRHTTFAVSGFENAPPAKRMKTAKKDLNKSSQGALFSPRTPRASFAMAALNSRVSFPDFRSPLAKTSPNKTPKKFDLEASLKKRLSYKPHQGKLKPLGENYSNTVKSKKEVKFREDVKTAKKPKSREVRRQNLAEQRKSTRQSALNKRRGVAC